MLVAREARSPKGRIRARDNEAIPVSGRLDAHHPAAHRGRPEVLRRYLRGDTSCGSSPMATSSTRKQARPFRAHLVSSTASNRPSDKDEATYLRLLDRHVVQPRQFARVRELAPARTAAGDSDRRRAFYFLPITGRKEFGRRIRKRQRDARHRGNDRIVGGQQARKRPCRTRPAPRGHASLCPP